MSCCLSLFISNFFDDRKCNSRRSSLDLEGLDKLLHLRRLSFATNFLIDLKSFHTIFCTPIEAIVLGLGTYLLLLVFYQFSQRSEVPHDRTFQP